MRTRTILALLVLTAAFIAGASTLLVEDSPYKTNVHVERTPIAPDRPAQLNATSAAKYAIAYEQTRLWTDLLASRGYSLDVSDDVVANCNATSVSGSNQGQFRVKLECFGDIDDTWRLFEPGRFTYDVTYRIGSNETVQFDIRGYPFNPGDALRTPRT